MTTPATVTVEAMTAADWPAIREIYAAGIATGDATFETGPPSWGQWDTDHLAEHRPVARTDGDVVGRVAAAAVSDQCCYMGVVEHSVYVHPEHQRTGIGRRLLEALIASTEAAGIWTIQTGIFPENTASVALHHCCGFRTIGMRERLGRRDGRWRDVLWLEHRSPVIA